MADDVPTPTPASTPTARERVFDPALIAELQTILATIPPSELPDGYARIALQMDIDDGYVDNLYRPFGASHYVIAWNDVPAYSDPRMTLAEWVAHCETMCFYAAAKAEGDDDA